MFYIPINGVVVIMLDDFEPYRLEVVYIHTHTHTHTTGLLFYRQQYLLYVLHTNQWGCGNYAR